MAQGKHVMVTGLPGVGKSTLVMSVLRQLSSIYDLSRVATGFYTEEVRGSKGRLGFDIVTLSGHRSPLARLGRGGRYCVGRYSVDVDGFNSIALPELVPNKETKLLVVDEIGKMELLSYDFTHSVSNLFEKGPVIFGVIPAKSNASLVQEIRYREDVILITVTQENRNRLVKLVLETLAQSLQESFPQ